MGLDSGMLDAGPVVRSRLVTKLTVDPEFTRRDRKTSCHPLYSSRGPNAICQQWRLRTCGKHSERVKPSGAICIDMSILTIPFAFWCERSFKFQAQNKRRIDSRKRGKICGKLRTSLVGSNCAGRCYVLS